MSSIEINMKIPDAAEEGSFTCSLGTPLIMEPVGTLDAADIADAADTTERVPLDTKILFVYFIRRLPLLPRYFTRQPLTMPDK